MGPTQPPAKWEPGAVSQMFKRPGREAQHSHASNTEVKNVGAISSLDNTPSGVMLNKLSTGSTLPLPYNHIYATALFTVKRFAFSNPDIYPSYGIQN